MSRRTAIVACLLLPMLPDLDVIGHIWVRYGDTIGHRGVFHSLTIAVLVALLTTVLLQRFGKIERTRRALVVTTLVFSGLVGSHGVVDAMTTGGKPIMLLWPLTTERLWLPWRFIPVSPFGKGLLKTRWTPDELRRAERYRRDVLAGHRDTHVLIRRFVGLSERPDHARRLAVAGIAATELALLAPLFLVATARWIKRRRAGRDPPEPEPQAMDWQAPRPALPRVVPMALGSIALAALAVALALWFSAPRSMSVRSGVLADRFATPWVRVAPASEPRSAPIAVLVHGWRCSHQMMMPLARVLARNGVVAYAVDLPGHGASPVPLETSCARGARSPCRVSSGVSFDRVLRPVVEKLAAEERFGDRQIVLLGHSTGAAAAHDLEGPFADRLRARILLEGRIGRLLRGGNVLVVGNAGYVRRFGRPVDARAGRFEDRSATLLYTSRRAHLELVRSARINRVILSWIRGSTGAAVGGDVDPGVSVDLAIAVALLLAALLGLHAALALARRTGRLPIGPPSSVARPGVAVTCLLLGAVPAALHAGELVRGGFPWLTASVRLTLPWFLLGASVWVAVPYGLAAWRPRGLRPRVLVRDVGLGVVAFAVLYAGAGLYADGHFWHARIGWGRVALWLGWAAAMLPVALVLREVGPHGPGPGRSLARFGLRMLLWSGLFWVHAVGVSEAMRSEVLGALGLVALGEVFASGPAWHAQSRLAGAVTVSLVVSWFAATAYPILHSTTAG
jgi:inner membrane protein